MARWLEAARAEWFSHPRLADRLAVLHVSRTLGLLHEDRPRVCEDPNDARDRRNHLRAVLSGWNPLAR